MNRNQVQALLVLEIDVEKFSTLAQRKEFNIKSILALFLFHQVKLKKNNQDYWVIREKFPI